MTADRQGSTSASGRAIPPLNRAEATACRLIQPAVADRVAVQQAPDGIDLFCSVYPFRGSVHWFTRCFRFTWCFRGDQRAGWFVKQSQDVGRQMLIAVDGSGRAGAPEGLRRRPSGFAA